GADSLTRGNQNKPTQKSQYRYGKPKRINEKAHTHQRRTKKNYRFNTGKQKCTEIGNSTFNLRFCYYHNL
ncbi:hypothetical protein, partial [Pseudomonas syringae]|uniref:hypothetical protein n=1 Tax=Pseudomonas syringae TaxID=317 RepID=UPI0034D96489